MKTPVPDLAATLADNLPAADLAALVTAAARGPRGLTDLRATTGSPLVRAACDDLLVAPFDTPDYLAGTLAGAAAAKSRLRAAQSLDVVWTGPESDVDTTRLTAAVLVDLIDQATSELLLVSYATHSEPRITAAVAAAIDRGAEVTVVLERSVDNPAYCGQGHPFPGLPVRRLAWPAAERPAGAALHAKLIVVDARLALVGSANLTGRAMDTNLECGVLIRGGAQPRLIQDHIFSLYHDGVLTRV